MAQIPNLDELTQVIDSENINENPLPEITETEGYDLTEVYNDSAEIVAPSGGRKTSSSIRKRFYLVNARNS